MLLEPKRNWLKANDVTSGDLIKIQTEGEWRENRNYKNQDGTPKQQFIIDIEYAGETKTLALNSTNRNSLIQEFGRDTANWIGKEAKITLVKQNVAGQLKDVIYLEPI